MIKTKVITRDLIDSLVEETKQSKKGWSRICLHSSPNDVIHSMVMCMMPYTESGFHYNIKSINIVTYAFIGYKFSIFSKNKVSSRDSTESILSKDIPVVGMPDNLARSVSNKSAQPIVYLEHRSGPYIKNDIIWL